MTRVHESLLDWQVRDLLQAVASTLAPDLSDAASAAARIRDPGGLAELWAAGIHPEDVAELTIPARSVVEPLPVSYFLGAAYGGVDPEWLASVLKYRPDPDIAAALAWSAPSVSEGDAREWGSWLRYGIRCADVEFVVKEGIAADTVAKVVRATGWSPAHSASMLVSWARAGCRAAPAHFVLLKRLGLDFAAPSKGALDGLCTDALRLDPTGDQAVERTELGALLVVLGNRAAVVAAVREGIRSVADLADETARECA